MKEGASSGSGTERRKSRPRREGTNECIGLCPGSGDPEQSQFQVAAAKVQAVQLVAADCSSLRL